MFGLECNVVHCLAPQDLQALCDEKLSFCVAGDVQQHQSKSVGVLY
jgi:hypothetical protein